MFLFSSIPLLLENNIWYKSLKCKKALNLQFKKRFIQQFNNSTMFFKHAEITVPSIAIKSTSFFMSERRRQTMSHLSRQGCLSHSCYLYQLQTLESSTSHSHFRVYVCLFGCTSAQISVRSHIILGLFLLPSFGQFSLAKPTPLFPHRLCQISSSCACVCQLGVIMLLITSPLCGIKLRGRNYKQYP